MHKSTRICVLLLHFFSPAIAQKPLDRIKIKTAQHLPTVLRVHAIRVRLIRSIKAAFSSLSCIILLREQKDNDAAFYA